MAPTQHRGGSPRRGCVRHLVFIAALLLASFAALRSHVLVGLLDGGTVDGRNSSSDPGRGATAALSAASADDDAAAAAVTAQAPPAALDASGEAPAASPPARQRRRGAPKLQLGQSYRVHIALRPNALLHALPPPPAVLETLPAPPDPEGGPKPTPAPTQPPACRPEWCGNLTERSAINVLYDPFNRNSSALTPRMTATEIDDLQLGLRIELPRGTLAWAAPTDMEKNPSGTTSDRATSNDDGGAGGLHPQPDTSLKYVKCTHRNAIVSFAIGYEAAWLQAFIASFQRHHTPCDELYLFMDTTALAVGTDTAKGNVFYVNRNTYLSRIDQMQRRGGGAGPSNQRFAVFNAWLGEGNRWRRYDFVLHADARDTVFFGDVFAPLRAQRAALGDALFSVGEVTSLYTNGFNIMWLEKYGATPKMLEAIFTRRVGGRNVSVPCSGTFGGTARAMRNYMMAFAHALTKLNRQAQATYGVDQGVHIYLQFFGLPGARFPHRVLMLDEALGPIRHWYHPSMLVVRDLLGRPVNCRGEVYPAVHQYDRHAPLWQDVLREYKHHPTCCAPGQQRGRSRYDPKPTAVVLDPRDACTAGMPAVLLEGTTRVAPQDRESIQTLPSVSEMGTTSGGDVQATPYAPADFERGTADASLGVHCAARNAFLAVYEQPPNATTLQPLIAAFQRYHTPCDHMVVFLPDDAAPWPRIAVAGTTPVVFEAIDATDGAAAAAGKRTRSMWAAARSAVVVARWLRARGGAYAQVVAVEGTDEQRVAIYSNVFQQAHADNFTGVWLLPAHGVSPLTPPAAVPEPGAMNASLTACADALGGIPLPDAWRVHPNAYGGAPAAVLEYVERSLLLVAWAPAACPAPVLRTGVAALWIAARAPAFRQPVAVLAERFGPFRHTTGHRDYSLKHYDHLKRPATCTGDRRPYAMVVGFVEHADDAHVWAAFLSNYPVRSEDPKAYDALLRNVSRQRAKELPVWPNGAPCALDPAT